VDLDNDLSTGTGDNHLRAGTHWTRSRTDADFTEFFFDLFRRDQLVFELVIRDIVELSVTTSKYSHVIFLGLVLVLD
jgi:hypothetical protein